MCPRFVGPGGYDVGTRPAHGADGAVIGRRAVWFGYGGGGAFRISRGRQGGGRPGRSSALLGAGRRRCSICWPDCVGRNGGKIRIDGQALRQSRPRAGMIRQDDGLPPSPWATVWENIALGLRVCRFYGPDGRHAPVVEIEGPVNAWLERLGLAAVWDDHLGLISESSISGRPSPGPRCGSRTCRRWTSPSLRGTRPPGRTCRSEPGA